MMSFFNKIINSIKNTLEFFKTHTSIRNSLSILILAIVLYYIFASIFNYSFLKDYSTYTNIIFLILSTLWLFSIIYSYSNFSESTITQKFINLLKRFSLITIGVGLLIYLIYLISSNEVFNSTLSSVLFILSIISVIAIIGFILSKFNIIQKLRNNYIFNFIYNFIFTIPLYITNFIITLKEDSKITPSYVYKLLFLSITLILSYILLPFLQSLIYTHNGIKLTENKEYTDQEKDISTFEKIHSPKKDKNKFNYNYTLSCWIFIENQGKNNSHNANKDCSILSYGDKPRITYNLTDQTLRIFMRDGLHGLKKVFETETLKLQKWNNIVINYNNGICDIFINGELVSSVNEIISYMRFDTIKIGTNDGIPGGICNIVYYKDPLTKHKIQWLYKMLKNNPCK